MNPSRPVAYSLVAGLLLTGLAVQSDADIRRVIVTQDESGTVKRTEEPIDLPADKKDDEDSEPRYHSHRYHKEASGGQIDLSGPTESTTRSDGFYVQSPPSISFGYSATHIFHNLTTRFESPNSSQLSWDNAPDIHGQGMEVALHPVDLGLVSLGFRGGYFQNSHTANAQQQGSLYAREQVKTSGGWGDLELMTAPYYGFSFMAGIGGLSYAVNTSVETNAPVYRYEGLTGSRNVMILGMGGQFEIPWSFSLKPFVQGRYWWTAGAGSALENGVGQFSAGLLWRF